MIPNLQHYFPNDETESRRRNKEKQLTPSSSGTDEKGKVLKYKSRIYLVELIISKTPIPSLLRPHEFLDRMNPLLQIPRAFPRLS